MTTVPVEPLVLKDYLVKIATDNYEKAVSAITLTPPSTTTETWSGPSGVDFSDEATNDAWKCQLDYVQDWETEDSLAGYLFDHQGETKTLIFTPRAGAGLPTFTVDVVIRSGPIGGQTRKFATSSTTMTCAEKPVRGVAA